MFLHFILLYCYTVIGFTNYSKNIPITTKNKIIELQAEVIIIQNQIIVKQMQLIRLLKERIKKNKKK